MIKLNKGSLFRPLLFILFLLYVPQVSHAVRFDRTAESILGVRADDKFTLYEPSYFIFGDDDLKLQFSFKYRLSKSFNLYFAYTQLMFWSIYEESKPFEDVNFKPEMFYRFFERDGNFLKTLDLGFLHTSNGKDKIDSRSLDRFFLRSTILTKLNRHYLGSQVKVYKIFNEDETNNDIQNYLGFWDLTIFLTDLLMIKDNALHLHVRTFAGSKVIDFDKGGYEIGLSYRYGNSDFNPSLYLQRYEGYAESLLVYDKKHTEYRMGLLLTF